MDFILILTNTGSEENAKFIAKTLVKEKYAACVNIIPKINSFYFWENEFIEDTEYMLIIKTRKNLYENVKNKIIKIHDYKLPEVISVSIDNGFDKYLHWIEKETKEQQ